MVNGAVLSFGQRASKRPVNGVCGLAVAFAYGVIKMASMRCLKRFAVGACPPRLGLALPERPAAEYPRRCARQFWGMRGSSGWKATAPYAFRFEMIWQVPHAVRSPRPQRSFYDDPAWRWGHAPPWPLHAAPAPCFGLSERKYIYAAQADFPPLLWPLTVTLSIQLFVPPA